MLLFALVLHVSLNTKLDSLDLDLALTLKVKFLDVTFTLRPCTSGRTSN